MVLEDEISKGLDKNSTVKSMESCLVYIWISFHLLFIMSAIWNWENVGMLYFLEAVFEKKQKCFFYYCRSTGCDLSPIV